MRRLAKNLILATAVVSVIFIVDLSPVEAANLNNEKFCPIDTYSDSRQYLDFWSKFRDTVMPDPDEPQNNNPPKEMRKPKPAQPAKPDKPDKPPKSAH